MINYPVVIETNRGTIRGTLVEVQPDHVVIEVSGRFYFVRIQQINWVMPSYPTHPNVPHPTHHPMT